MFQGTRRIPPTHLLLTFDAVAHFMSFIRAANHLNISGSAVSHRISELECFLGISLFERDTRSVALTPDGHCYLAIVRSALRQLESATGSITGRHETLRLSVLPSFARFWLIPRLADFYSAHPAIAIEVDSTTRVAQIDKGEADIAIRYSKAPGEHFLCEKMLEDAWLPVVHPHLFAQGEARMTTEEVFASFPILEHARQPWEPWFDIAGMQPPRTCSRRTFTDTALMIDAALHCHGVALVRWSLVSNLVQSEQLSLVSSMALPSEYSYFLIASDRVARHQHFRLAIDWLRASAKNYQSYPSQNACNGD